MKKDIDIKKIRAEAKKFLKKAGGRLKEIGDQTAVLAKRGERELTKITKVGRVEVDILGLSLKKNQLFYELGKEVYKLNSRGKLTVKNLKKLCGKIEQIEKNLKTKKRAAAKYLKKKK